MLTASGLDMHHFFANYTVHGNTDKAAKWLTKARTRIVVIAATLPVWMTVKSCVRLVGWILPSLERWLAKFVPAVPGLSIGAEPLTVKARGVKGGSSSSRKEDDETIP